MSYSRRSRYSQSPSPDNKRYNNRSVSRSLSRSRRSRSRSPSVDVDNPGDNLYVTGFSPRVTKRELEKHFAAEGTVVDVRLVTDPWTRESRGFGFVTMSRIEEAERCIKYLDRSVLEGRVITVEKARRRKGRTPTPGRYLGLRTVHVRRRSPSYSPRRSPSYTPYRRSLSRSPRSGRSRSRSGSPFYRRRRSYTPYYRRQRSSFSLYESRGRSYSRSRSPYRGSPVRRLDRSNSPYDLQGYSPEDAYYYGRRYRSRDYSPDVHYCERKGRYRSVSRSLSPRTRSRHYSRRVSPRARSWHRSYLRSISPEQRSVKCRSPYARRSSRRYSRRSYSTSRSPSRTASESERSVSRSP